MATIYSADGTAKFVVPEKDYQAYLARGFLSEAQARAKQEARQRAEFEAWLASQESEAERFALLRQKRNKLLAQTDYLLAPDYQISGGDLSLVKTYRKALRDLPGQAGAPWDGGGENTPWPQLRWAGGAPSSEQD